MALAHSLVTRRHIDITLCTTVNFIAFFRRYIEIFVGSFYESRKEFLYSCGLRVSCMSRGKLSICFRKHNFPSSK